MVGGSGKEHIAIDLKLSAVQRPDLASGTSRSLERGRKSEDTRYGKG